MEKLNELIFLLPDYELEGYPRSLADDKAAQLLAGWVGLWHPVLMFGVGRIPRWHQATRLPSELSSTLFVLPPISKSAISETAPEEIANAGGLLLEPPVSWIEFQGQILSHFPQLVINDLARELAAEFAAIGYAFLQVQLMTRQLRYTSNLDVPLFEEQVMKAAEAVMENDSEKARTLLQACFDTLGQERDHYYSNDANLIDITLLADTTLGKSLHKQLSDQAPTSLIASADILRKLKEKSAENFARVIQRIQEGSLAIAGGLDHETPWPLSSREVAVRALAAGPQAYRDLNIEPPTVFARMSFGLSADSASLLSRFGYRGVVLMPFTGGSYPTSNQTKISWESQDGGRIPALVGPPLDAANASSFLAFGWSLGEALDRQHVPTMVFAHWPGKQCEFFDLLRIVTERTPALGRFVLIDKYFTDTSSPYHHERLEVGQFSYNWLAETDYPGEVLQSSKQAQIIQSRIVSLKNLLNLIYQLQNLRTKVEWPKDDKGEATAPLYTPIPLDEWAGELQKLLCELDLLIAQPERPSEDHFQNCITTVDRLRKQCEHALVPLLAGKKATPAGHEDPKSQGAGFDVAQSISGKLLVNPRSNAVRVSAKSSADRLFTDGQSWNFASGINRSERLTCIDLPSLGFVVAPYAESTASKNEKLTLADSDGILRNEFVEAQIDARRGHLRSLHIPAKRGNRLSAMIAYRVKNGSKYEHSEMVARNLSILENSNMLGAVRVEGLMQWQGKSVGDFSIEYEVRRGSRVLSAKIGLSNLKFTDERNPWLSAFVLRLAWPNESAILRTFPDGRRTAWGGSKLIAPDLIEIDEVDYQTHYLTGGLAFHARQELRFLETILAVAGQSSVEHQIGLAVDLPYPLSTAQQFVDADYQVDLSGSITPSSGWLVSIDSKSVHVDLECPLQDDQGRLVGLRVLVSELHGRSITANVQFFRDIAEASRVDYCGNKVSRVTADGDTLTIALRAGEQSLVDLLWKA